MKDEPITIKDVICYNRKGLQYSNDREHHITILFECQLPDGFEINNGNKRENDAGYLKWFDKVPENLLQVHDVYKGILTEWERKEK